MVIICLIDFVLCSLGDRIIVYHSVDETDSTLQLVMTPLPTYHPQLPMQQP